MFSSTIVRFKRIDVCSSAKTETQAAFSIAQSSKSAQIDADIHVPLFEDVLRVMAGIPNRKLVTITE